MHARSASTNNLVVALFLAALFTVLATAACTPKKPALEAPAPAPPVTINPESLDVDTAYSEGLHAFWIGDYKTSAVLFESLARRVDDQAFRSRALYGLACSKLAVASTPDEMNAARAAWKDWERASSSSLNMDDPRMLSPFVESPRFFPAVKDGREPKPQARNDQEMAKRLQEKEKEVLLLQKQIKALEAIHREIQEKKKMSTQ